MSALKPGDRFTIEGVGVGKRGWFVWSGICIGTGRKAKIVKPAVYTVTAALKGAPKTAHRIVGI